MPVMVYIDSQGFIVAHFTVTSIELMSGAKSQVGAP